MIIVPLDDIHVQRHTRILRPAAKPMMNHLRIQRPHHRRLETEIADEERARRDINDSAGEGFIKRGVSVTETCNAGAGTEGRGEGRAESEKGVFGCMVVVDCQ